MIRSGAIWHRRRCPAYRSSPKVCGFLPSAPSAQRPFGIPSKPTRRRPPEPTPRELRVHLSPSHVHGLGNPKITEQPAPQVPSKPTRRRPLLNPLRGNFSGHAGRKCRSPRSLPPSPLRTDTPSSALEPASRKLQRPRGTEVRDHRAGLPPPSPLRTDTPSSALETHFEETQRPRGTEMRDRRAALPPSPLRTDTPSSALETHLRKFQRPRGTRKCEITASLPPKSPPNRHAVVRREPTLRKL